MGKNKKKTTKKQQKAPFNEPNVQEVEVDQQPMGGSAAGIDADQELADPQNSEDTQDHVNSTERPADEQIEKLKDEIRDLKLQLARQADTQKDENEQSSTTEIQITEIQAYKDLKAERDEFESQYNNLLNRISSMKTVFSKMKESQEELENVKEQLTEYEHQNTRLKNKVDLLNKEKIELEKTISTLNEEFSQLDDERETIQNESNAYKEEVDRLTAQLERISEDHARKLEASSEMNEQLEAELQELLVSLDNHKKDLSTLAEEKNDLVSALEESAAEKETLQRSVEELESELDKVTSQFEEDRKQVNLEVNALRVQLDKSQESNVELAKTIEKQKEEIRSMSEDVAAKKGLEQECKERVLQIGKLRHEAIILNEHLTKALTMLKQSSDSESVDKELISNLLISFVAIPRADPRKFEVLDLISSFLNWDDDKKRQAGLLHDNQRVPRSAESKSNTENFVSLWTEFLEKESEK